MGFPVKVSDSSGVWSFVEYITAGQDAHIYTNALNIQNISLCVLSFQNASICSTV